MEEQIEAQETEAPESEQVSEQTNDEQDVTPEAPVVEEEEEDVSPFQNLPQTQQVSPLSQEDLQINPETGEVDVNALLGAFNTRLNEVQQSTVTQSNNMAQLRDQYKSEWEKAEKKYPELKENRQLKEWVYARHADALEREGKYLSPTKAADQLFGITKQAQQKGMETANANVEVQKSARLESSNSTTRQSVSSDLKAQLNSSNPVEAATARRAILAQRIREGRL